MWARCGPVLSQVNASGYLRNPCSLNRERDTRRTSFHYRSRRSANEEVQQKQSKYRARKNATEGLIWQLCEGREI